MYVFEGQYSVDDWDRWTNSVAWNVPAPRWRQYESVEQAGWSEAALDEARRYSSEIGSAAVMIVFGGAVLAHWGGIARRYPCHSIRKGLLNAVYGEHVVRGTIELAETLEAIGIDDATALTKTEKQARVGDLLKSRSGIYLPAAYEDPKAQENRPPRGSFDPGTHWHYNNWDFNALATIFDRKTGTNIGSAFAAQLAGPLQMQDFQPRHCYYRFEPEKSIHPAYVFRMSARDLARVGLLYLRQGRWGETQVLPASWIEQSIRAYSEARGGGYGYMWWIEGGHLSGLGAYAAAGWGGHRMHIIPRAQLVVVHRADTYAERQVNDRDIHGLLNKILLGRVGRPAPEPRLIDLDEGPVPVRRSVWPGPDLERLCGEFVQGDARAVVRRIGGQLELEVPSGRFYLFSRSGAEFDVEDWNCRLEFMLDEFRETNRFADLASV